jgi:DNA polymerase
VSLLRVDIETYSGADLLKVGVYKYTEHPDFQVMLFSYQLDDAPVFNVDLMEESLSADIVDMLQDPTIIKTAWNANFEITCLSKHLGVKLDAAQWRCTMVHALSLGFPGSLAAAGKVAKLPIGKAKMGVGKSLIFYFCKPCKPTKANGKRTRNLPHHDPEKWQLFREYCNRDVEAEAAMAAKLDRFPFPEIEHAAWVLDQRINDRGILVDRNLVRRAIELDALYAERCINEAILLTGLSNPNSVKQLKDWLKVEEDLDLEKLNKETVPEAIEAAVPGSRLHRVLELRLEMAKSSVKKYAAMERAACEDDRVRGAAQFCGANRTWRWAGRIVQYQNMSKNTWLHLQALRAALVNGDFELLEMLWGAPPAALSQLVRTATVPPPGKKLWVADFNSIEARLIAWAAQVPWRLEVFATHGKIYETSAEQMFHLSPGSVDKKSPYRQKGKVAELALGFGGGVNALIRMGALKGGILEDELPSIRDAWRLASLELTDWNTGLWARMGNAAVEAVKDRCTRKVRIGPVGEGIFVTFEYKNGFLFMHLPCGFSLSYIKPAVIIGKYGSEQVSYEGQDQVTKQWIRTETYGAQLFQNMIQAMARACLRDALFNLEDADIPVIFHVHDEAIGEFDPKDTTVLPMVSRIMSITPPWAPGLLLKGEPEVLDFYMKGE